MDFDLNEDLFSKFYSVSRNSGIYLNGKGSNYFFALKERLDLFSEKLDWFEYDFIDGDGLTYLNYNILFFYGIPSGSETEPFLRSIAEISSEKTVDNEIEVSLYVSSMCPHCPGVFKKLIDILKEIPVITKIYFADSVQDALDADNVMSVPTLIIKNRGIETARWTGMINRDDVEKFIRGVELSEVSEDYFINLLEQGKASEVSKIICEKKKLFKGFLSLFYSDKWSVRLGAVVTAEFLTEDCEDLFELLLDELFEKYFDLSIQIKGDILYLAGMSNLKKKRIGEIENFVKNEIEETLLEVASESLVSLRLS